MQQIIQGDALQVLRTLPDGLADCCVTSPPYYALRDYGVDGQIGLEETLEEYVEKLVQVFREVRRVLRDDGTLWLNLGDSYAGSWKGGGGLQDTNKGSLTVQNTRTHSTGIKEKDLMGIPWRVALALQADGWYLRQDIIWNKPNPMPESVTDRCTKAHEYIFLLSKAPRYYYDHEAIKEPAVGFETPPPAGSSGAFGPPQSRRRKGNNRTFRGGGVYTSGRSFDNSGDASKASQGNKPNESGLRNKRSVWTVAVKGYPGAHFATFPPDLIRDCIRAGCREGGIALDPFFGSGTTGEVAAQENRGFIGIELNPKYIPMAEDRLLPYRLQPSLFERRISP